jgi:hypothetical protein
VGRAKCAHGLTLPSACVAVTEKLLTALLSGALPIYYGPPEALQAFNPRRIIYCGDLGDDPTELARSCARRVAQVYSNHR